MQKWDTHFTNFFYSLSFTFLKTHTESKQDTSAFISPSQIHNHFNSQIINSHISRHIHLPQSTRLSIGRLKYPFNVCNGAPSITSLRAILLARLLHLNLHGFIFSNLMVFVQIESRQGNRYTTAKMKFHLQISCLCQHLSMKDYQSGFKIT